MSAGALVPALMAWPTFLREPKVIATPCVTSDIYLTLGGIARVMMENQLLLDGIDLMPLISGQATKHGRPLGF